MAITCEIHHVRSAHQLEHSKRKEQISRAGQVPAISTTLELLVPFFLMVISWGVPVYRMSAAACRIAHSAGAHHRLDTRLAFASSKCMPCTHHMYASATAGARPIPAHSKRTNWVCHASVQESSSAGVGPQVETHAQAEYNTLCSGEVFQFVDMCSLLR